MIKKILFLVIVLFSQLLNAYYKIPFSKDEKAFLKQHPVIRISPDPYFKPVEYIDKNGNYKGMSADFMDLVSRELGVKFKLIQCKDWEEVLQKAKNREIDLLPAAAQTSDREKYMDFSNSYLSFPEVIITLKSDKTIHKINNLFNKRVAIGKGYVWEELVSRDYPKIKIAPVSNLKTGFIKLSNKEVDAVIASLPIALELIKTGGFTNLQIAGESGYYTKLSILTRNDWPRLSIIIDKVLQNISNEGKKQIQDKWLGRTIENQGKTKLVKIIISFLFIALLIILIVLIWNKSLKIKIEQKTEELYKEMQKLKEKEKENFKLTQIQNKIIENPKFWISIFDKDGNIVLWNKAAENISGYTKKDAFSKPKKEVTFRHAEGDVTSGQVIKQIYENRINYEDHESKIVTKNHQLKDVSFFTRIIEDQEGKPSGLIIIGREITQEKLAEEQTRESLDFLYFLNKLSSSISYSYDLYEVSKTAIQQIRNYFKDTFIIIFLANKEKTKLKSYYWEGNKDNTWQDGAIIPIEGSISGKSFLDKKVKYVFDLLGDKRVDHRITDALYAQGLRSLIIVPLAYNDESFGTINIVSEKENYLAGNGNKLNAIGKIVALSLKNSMYVDEIKKQIDTIKETKENLIKRNEEYKNLLYYNPYGIIVHQKGIVKYCNRALLNILDIENAEELLNRNLMPYFHPDSQEIAKERMNIDSTESKFIPPIEEKIISKKGIIKYVETSGFSLNNGDKLVMVNDITKRIQAEQEKEEMQNHLIQNDKMEAIGLLAGGIAHDFNNFLTIITGSIDILSLITKNQEKVQNILYTASKATENAKNLTQQLLTFSKGGEPIKKTSSLIDIVKDTANFVLSGTKIKPQFDIDEKLWMCKVDEGQISQVIQNIVINARQVMPGGGVIRISMKNVGKEKHLQYHLKDENYVEIAIKDEGPGISKTNLEKIFTPYFTTKKEGNGIGLAVCYSIIKKHGGLIFAESKEYFGTTFKIYLPAINKSNNSALDSISHNKKDEMSGKILIMDDEEMILEIGKEMLELLGFEVKVSKNGDEAIEYYSQELENNAPFDLVIVDLTVPGNKGGKEATEELLKIDKNVKVIVSSGYSNSQILENYKDYGFVGKIIKPYTLDKLVKVIKNVLKNKDSGE